MDVASRVLDDMVTAALTHRPGTARDARADPAELQVLVPFFNGLLAEWPWWDRAWRVTRVGAGTWFENARSTAFTEVAVPGTLGHDSGDTLPWSGRVRVRGDRLIRFEAKVGETVIGPGLRGPGEPEWHPFGPVLVALMETRGISVKEMARRCGLSMSTVRMLQAGAWNPHPRVVALLAAALDIDGTDLLAIAGHDVR